MIVKANKKITLKFKIGQSVWFSQDGVIKEGKICSFKLRQGDEGLVHWGVNAYKCADMICREDRLFSSLKQLLFHLGETVIEYAHERDSK